MCSRRELQVGRLTANNTKLRSSKACRASQNRRRARAGTRGDRIMTQCTFRSCSPAGRFRSQDSERTREIPTKPESQTAPPHVVTASQRLLPNETCSCRLHTRREHGYKKRRPITPQFLIGFILKQLLHLRVYSDSGSSKRSSTEASASMLRKLARSSGSTHDSPLTTCAPTPARRAKN